MGLLDYYKQFEGMSDEEVSIELRRVSDERRRLALSVVEPIDLSATTWPEFPHPDVAAAVTYMVRRNVNAYPDPHAHELRMELSRRHGLEPGRVVAGNGAAQLMKAAAQALLEPGDELVTFWPSYPLYPIMARDAHATAVPVPGHDADALLAAVTGDTRLVVVCNPNDPTGTLLATDELRSLLERLPERVSVLLDEALIDYVASQPRDAALDLLEDFPRLIVFRTFSKIHGLAGLRCGYALGGPGSDHLLERLEPPLGVDALAQVGAFEALRKQETIVAARRAGIATERARLLDALADLPVDAPASQANFLWLSAPGIDGPELAARLERFGVIVRSGATLGAGDHVRAQIQDRAAGDRLLRALESALANR